MVAILCSFHTLMVLFISRIKDPFFTIGDINADAAISHAELSCRSLQSILLVRGDQCVLLMLLAVEATISTPH